MCVTRGTQFGTGYCSLGGLDILINGFSAFLSLGRCKKQFTKNSHENILLSEVWLCQFSQSTKCFTLIFTLNSFKDEL